MKLKFGRKGTPRPGAAAGMNSGMTSSDLVAFQNLLYRKSGIVLNDSKKALVESRVTQRLRALNMDSYGGYLQFLDEDKSINNTHFFREPDHFEMLESTLEKWTAQGMQHVRIWSAACSTGEEPYTIAMTVDKLVQERRLDLKILATDISTRVLAHAKAGVYQEDRLTSIPDHLKAKHFRIQPGQGKKQYAVSNQLKRLMMFHRLNFTVFPYPINGIFDVIFCRNAMIYFDRDLRMKMVREFARLLKPGGLLMIGHAETLIGLENQYRTIKPSIYQRLK